VVDAIGCDPGFMFSISAVGLFNDRNVSGSRPAAMFAGDIDLAEAFVFLFIL